MPDDDEIVTELDGQPIGPEDELALVLGLSTD